MTKSRRNTIIDRPYNSKEYDLHYNDSDEKNIRFVRITEKNSIDNGMTLYFITSKEESLRPHKSWINTDSQISRLSHQRVVETIRFTISNEDGQTIRIRERIIFDSEKYLVDKIQLPKKWNYLFNRPEPASFVIKWRSSTMSKRSWKSTKFTDVQPSSSVGLFMTRHGRIQMDFSDTKKIKLKPLMHETFFSKRSPTEAGFIFENEPMNDTLSVDFKQARPKDRQRIRPGGQSEGSRANPEGQTIGKCQIQTDCNNCFLMIKSRDQIFGLNGILRDDVLRDKRSQIKNSVSFQVIYGFPCSTGPDNVLDGLQSPESELKWIDVTTNAILSFSKDLILSMEDKIASGMLKTNDLIYHPNRQETFITAEFLNTKVKMIFDVLTPRRININIHDKILNLITGCNDFSDNTIQPVPIHQTSKVEASVMFQSQWSHRKIEMEIPSLLNSYEQVEFWSENSSNMFRLLEAGDYQFYITDHRAKNVPKWSSDEKRKICVGHSKMATCESYSISSESVEIESIHLMSDSSGNYFGVQMSDDSQVPVQSYVKQNIFWLENIKTLRPLQKCHSNSDIIIELTQDATSKDTLPRDKRDQTVVPTKMAPESSYSQNLDLSILLASFIILICILGVSFLLKFKFKCHFFSHTGSKNSNSGSNRNKPVIVYHLVQ